MRKRIIFRADSSPNIGLGHVFRLLSLAHILKNEFDCIFVSHSAPQFLLDELKTMAVTFTKVEAIDYSNPDNRREAEEVPSPLPS